MGRNETRDGIGDQAGEPTPHGEARMAKFILRVRLGERDSPSGTIGRSDQDTHLAFNGWMDFMGALNRLPAEAELTLGQAPR